jgi:hypothetical protein
VELTKCGKEHVWTRRGRMSAQPHTGEWCNCGTVRWVRGIPGEKIDEAWKTAYVTTQPGASAGPTPSATPEPWPVAKVRQEIERLLKAVNDSYQPREDAFTVGQSWIADVRILLQHLRDTTTKVETETVAVSLGCDPGMHAWPAERLPRDGDLCYCGERIWIGEPSRMYLVPGSSLKRLQGRADAWDKVGESFGILTARDIVRTLIRDLNSHKHRANLAESDLKRVRGDVSDLLAKLVTYDRERSNG